MCNRATPNYRKTALAVFTLVASCIPAWAQEQSPPTLHTVDPGYITVAIYGNSLPTIAVNAGGTLEGIQGAVLERAAEAADLEIKVFQTTFAGAITAVQQGRADVGTNTYWTAERSKTLRFTDATHILSTYWVMRADTPYSGPESLAGQKVGIAQGYVQAPYLQKALGRDLVVELPGDAQGLQAVANGQIVAYLAGGTAFSRIENSTEFEMHEAKPGEFGIPKEFIINRYRMYVSCENPELGRFLDEQIDALRQSGEMRSILAAEWKGPGNAEAARELPQDGCS